MATPDVLRAVAARLRETDEVTGPADLAAFDAGVLPAQRLALVYELAAEAWTVPVPSLEERVRLLGAIRASAEAFHAVMGSGGGGG